MAKGPKPYKVFYHDGKHMRKVSEYETQKQFERKLSLYSRFPAPNPVFVTITGEWYRVVFKELGTKDAPGWKLVKSEGVEVGK